MPHLRLFFFALCLCLVPCLPHAEDLFIVYSGTPSANGLDNLEIIPVTSSGQDMSPTYSRAVYYHLHGTAKGAADMRDETLRNGNIDAFFAMAALSKLAETEKRRPKFGAPAAFWEDWAVRILEDEKEAWFRIGAALFECSKEEGLPKTKLQQMATDALRKAARLGHVEAMFALAFLAPAYPDKSFQMPKDPGFTIIPPFGEASPEARYWISAAAAHGSARANYVFGLAYGKKPETEQQAIEMLVKSMRLGMAPAASELAVRLTPLHKDYAFPRHANCRSGLYYGIIAAKMFGLHDPIEYERLAENMMQGNNEHFPEACLTRKEYEDAIRKAEKEFKSIEADMRVQDDARSRQYSGAKHKVRDVESYVYRQAR